MAELLAATDLLVVTEPGPHAAQSAGHIEEASCGLWLGEPTTRRIVVNQSAANHRARLPETELRTV